MHPSSSVIKLTIALPATHHAAYAEAVRLLIRVMGRKAPDVLSLIVHSLRCRDSRGLAEDYLESINWPKKRRTLPHRRQNGLDSVRSRRSTRRVLSMIGPTGDPARN